MPDIRRPEIACADGDKAIVTNHGKFAGGPYNCGGQLPPGKYFVEVGAPLAEFQPLELRSVLGPAYANFTGKPMKDTEFGRTLAFETIAIVGGPRNRSAEKELRARRVGEIRAKARADCPNRPAQIEKLTGNPVLNSDEVVQQCIVSADTMNLDVE